MASLILTGLIFQPILNNIQSMNRVFRSAYFRIKPLDHPYSTNLDSFSYDKLTASFYHNNIDYINKFKEQCIPFELFNDISKNTDKFNELLLVDNQYIIEEYQKLTLEEKEKLIQDETMNNFFNEIHSILNSQNF